MKKKILTILLSAVMAVGCMCGFGSCGSDDDGKISIVTTIFPEYDWVMNILGEKKDGFKVTMLLENGVDLHSYSPTFTDIVEISKCDMFLYVGGESEKWTKEALKAPVNEERIEVDLFNILGDKVKEEEAVEGMQEEEHDHEEGEEHDHEEEVEYDEHVWLSLKNTKFLIGKVAEQICKLDEGNADYYTENARKYGEKIDELDGEFAEMVASANRDTVLFADRFPFRYLADDYGLKYYAAFAGCSAETDASFETMAFLVNKVNELDLKVILQLESAKGDIAKTVKRDAAADDIEILTANSLQSSTKRDFENGVTYLSLMRENLEVFRKALA